MDINSYKTKSSNKQSVIRSWLLIDADQCILGHLASKIATLLRGKHKPCYTPHVDCGDHIVVINASKVKLTGKKMDQQEYISHTGYPGGQKSITPAVLHAAKPTALVHRAVKGMLPKTKLGNALCKKLHIYPTDVHPHIAQNPKTITL